MSSKAAATDLTFWRPLSPLKLDTDQRLARVRYGLRPLSIIRAYYLLPFPEDYTPPNGEAAN